jgi:HEAT repeat protein
MPLTLDQVRHELEAEEPDYVRLVGLGPEALPQLLVLVQEANETIAPKAAYLASLIASEQRTAVLAEAAKSPVDTVRIAAALGLRNIEPEAASPILDTVLRDADVGVRKAALRSTLELGVSMARAKVEQISREDPADQLRRLATEMLAETAESGPAKRAPAKKTRARKTPAKKTATKKTTTRKAPAKKTATKKTTTRNTPAKKMRSRRQ